MKRTRAGVVVVGDHGTGKSSLIKRLTSDRFPEYYIGLTLDTEEKSVQLSEDEEVVLNFWDTCGLDSYDNVRVLVYPLSKLFLVLYSLDSQPSLRNVNAKWVEEVRRHVPKARIVVVGNKVDLREEGGGGGGGEWAVSGGEEAAAAGHLRHAECSAKTGQGVAAILLTLANLATVRKRKSCTVL